MAKDQFQDWKEREALAESMIPMIGRLYRDHNVVTSIYGRSIINRSVIDILKAHKFVRQVESSGLSVRDTYPVLEVLSKLKPGASRIDIGKLAVGYQRNGEGASLEDYVRSQVEGVLAGSGEVNVDGQDVVLYGFGRIGRLMARILIERAGSGSGPEPEGCCGKKRVGQQTI